MIDPLLDKMGRIPREVKKICMCFLDDKDETFKIVKKQNCNFEMNISFEFLRQTAVRN